MAIRGFSLTEQFIRRKRLAKFDPDHELMLRIARKDIDAFRDLLVRHLDRCVKVAERMLGNRQDAEDVMQEVCLKIWKEASRWKPQAKFSTWLYRVLLNACLDHKRKTVAYVQEELEFIPDKSPSTDERMIEEQSSQHVQNALQRLPDRQRAAVILSYYEDLSNQEAAETMGVGLGAFQQLLFRAKQNLRNELIDDVTGRDSYAARAG